MLSELSIEDLIKIATNYYTFVLNLTTESTITKRLISFHDEANKITCQICRGMPEKIVEYKLTDILYKSSVGSWYGWIGMDEETCNVIRTFY
jgi:hypothetical protein